MKYLRRRFVAGLLILLPVVVTSWILWKVFSSVDSVLEPVQQRYPIIDHPGVGFGVVIIIVLLTGVFAGNFIVGEAPPSTYHVNAGHGTKPFGTG